MSKLDFVVPRWLVVGYGLLGIALLPWIANLSGSLPLRHVVRHWDLMWVGFDVMLLVVVALTAYFALRNSPAIILSLSATAALLTMDAWFDILTSRPGLETSFAITMAVALELPIALVSLWYARRLLRQLRL